MSRETELAEELRGLNRQQVHRLATALSVNVVHLSAALRPRDCAEPGHRPPGLWSRDNQSPFGESKSAEPDPEDDE